MKPTVVLTVLIVVIAVLLDVFLQRNAQAQVARAGIESYMIVSVVPGQSDAQTQAQLNALAADGWKVRCSLPSGLVLAR